MVAQQPSLRTLLEREASKFQRRGLELTIAAASRQKAPVYLVGGSIRDLLITGEIQDVDLDLAVEGDAMALAAEVVEELQGDLETHPRFLTAEVRCGLSHLDFVSTRQESYAGLASLPEVTPGDLQTDLARRDFSINAMALPLWPDQPPDLIDPYGGQRDAELRQLRILHDRSFLDDPTRILRGVRLGARLDLRFEERTAELAREAIAAGAFEPLSSDRLRHELILLLEDRQLETALRHLETLGFFTALVDLQPILARDWQVLARAMEIRSQWEESAEDLPRLEWWLVFLTALVSGQDRTTRSAISLRLGLSEELGTRMIAARDRLEGALEALQVEGMPGHSIHRVLSRLPAEDLPVLLSLAPPSIADRIDRWLRVLRPLRLSIGGRDLIEAGFVEGPALGPALEATLDARLDGLIDADQELEFAKRFLTESSGEQG